MPEQHANQYVLDNTGEVTEGQESTNSNTNAESNPAYLADTKEIFSNFEQYYWGEPAFPKGLIMENGQTIGPFQAFPSTSNIQNPKYNFINLVTARKEIENDNGKVIEVGYKYNGTFIQGCEKGTVVLAKKPTENKNNTFFSGEIENGKMDPTAVEISAAIDETSKKKILYVKDDRGIEQFDEQYFKDRGNQVFPRRIGILLVGGGGGAGGATWYDPNKNGSGGDQFHCPGSSGGGAGAIWGVIDIDWLFEATSNKYYIKSSFDREEVALRFYKSYRQDWSSSDLQIKGDSGKAVGYFKNRVGTIYNDDYTDYKYFKFDNLKNGWADFCNQCFKPEWTEYYDYGSTYTYNNYKAVQWQLTYENFFSGIGGIDNIKSGTQHLHPHKGKNGRSGASIYLYKGARLIAWANGGGYGSAGHWKDEVTGGSAGGAGCDKNHFWNCTPEGTETGYGGLTLNPNTKRAEMPAREFLVNFYPDNTADQVLSYKQELEKIENDEWETVDKEGRYWVPGGHSYGTGASKDSPAGYGGGGCSNSANKNGGNLYWALFY